MLLKKNKALSLLALVLAAPAAAYPIDCAIFLCMAGGFPASTECTAAKIEMIRRVTPIPVEPALQLWRCPMSGLSLGADGIPTDPEFAYLSKLRVIYSTHQGGQDTYRNSIQSCDGSLQNCTWLKQEFGPRKQRPGVDTSLFGVTIPALKAPRAITVIYPDHEGHVTLEDWIRY